MARASETVDEKPPRMKLLSGLAAFFLVGGAAVLGLFGSGAYDKMTGATSRSVAPAGPISYATVSDGLVNANTIRPVVVTPVNRTAVPVEALPTDAVTVPSWRAVEDSKGSTESGGVLKPGSTIKKDPEKEASAGTSAVCYPKNGYEVVKMVNGSASPCRVIVLTRPFTYGYKIERQINVTQPKIIVGNPIALPMLNCSKKVERCFEVMPGGRLDARFVQMVRGGGRYLNNDERLNFNFGTHVLVRPGGDFTGTGVWFRERNHTLASFMNEVENTVRLGLQYLNFNIGQYVAVIGGNLFLQGCLFTRIRPYGAGYLTNFSLGREVAVIAGNAVFTGVVNILYTLFSSYPYMSGKVLCVLGGTATMIGGGSFYATGAQLQLGWGIDLTTLGGVLVTIGWSYSAWNAALCRIGGGQFGVGGGTVYHTGLTYATGTGAGGYFGAGVTHVNGGGSLTYIGGAYTSFTITTIFAGVGGWVFQGSGSSTFIAIPQSRYGVTRSVYGNGGVFYMGAGILTQIANPSYNAYLVYWVNGAASDTFIGAGWLTSIRNIKWQFQLLYGMLGIGNAVYIGAGGAIFINSYYNFKRLRYWRNWRFTYTVGGTAYKTKTTPNEVVRITKDKVTVDYIDFNKLHGYMNCNPTSVYQGCMRYTNLWVPTARPTAAPTVARRLEEEEEEKAPAESSSSSYPRMLQEAAEWLEQAVEANGGFDPQLNKIVMLGTTTFESRGDGRFPTQAEYELNGRGTPYAKYLAEDALANPYPPATINSVMPGKVAVKNASCFLCGLKPGTTADHVDPDSACEVEEGCAGGTALQTIGTAQTKTDMELGFPGVGYLPKGAATMDQPAVDPEVKDLPDLHFLWYDMTVYCRSTDTEVDDGTIMENCLTADYVKRIVGAYIQLSGLDQGFDMTVAPTAVHGAVTGLMGADDPVLMDLQMATVPEWNPDCQGYTRYELQFSTQFPELKAELAKIMDAMVEDPTEMSQNIVQNADKAAELQPCSVTLAKKADMRFPSINNMPAYQPSSRSKVGPDVVVSDGKSIVPADEVVPGNTYQIWVQNFPRGSKVNIQLVTGRKDSGPIIATIENFSDDGISDVITWTAPAALDPTQRYYLKAAADKVPALFANSQVLRGRRG